MLITYVFLIVNQMQINFLNFYIHSILTSNLHLTNKIIKKNFIFRCSTLSDKHFYGNFKNCSKIPPLPLYNVANPKHSLTQILLIVSNIVKRGEEKKSFPNSSFPHKVCH